MMLKKFVFIILAVAVSLYLVGCGKKEQALEEMQEPMSMEALSTAKPMAEVGTPTTPLPLSSETKLAPLPPSGPYKPTAIEIQTALKNAGYYAGNIDGKIGPLTKKAIEEFQKANALKADGKVGPKTWEILSKHLNPTPVVPPKKR